MSIVQSPKFMVVALTQSSRGPVTSQRVGSFQASAGKRRARSVGLRGEDELAAREQLPLAGVVPAQVLGADLHVVRAMVHLRS